MSVKNLLGDDLYKAVKEKLGDKADKLIVNDSGEFIPKERLDSEIAKRKEAEGELEGKTKEIEAVNGKLTELQKAAEGNDELKSQLAKMQEEVETVKTEAQKTKREMAIKTRIEADLTRAGVDPEYIDFISGKISVEKLAVSDDLSNITGIDEQVKSLKETHSKFFGKEVIEGTVPIDGDVPKKDFFTKDEVEKMDQVQVKENLPVIEKSMTKW